MPKKLVSIITVVFNDIANIEATIKSVINQDYDHLEYVVIDGGSSDGTRDIISRYSKDISIYISEKDQGIYDAMNKGIKLAKGDWIIFMNSGDRFFSESVVSEAISQAIDCDIIYGNMVDTSNNNTVKPRKLNDFWKGLPFNHQSTIVKTKLHKEFPFNLDYPISAVYDFFYYFYNNSSAQFKYIDLNIAYYDMYGLSGVSLRWVNDYWKINKKYSRDIIIKVLFRAVYIYLVRLKNIIMRRLHVE